MNFDVSRKSALAAIAALPITAARASAQGIPAPLRISVTPNDGLALPYYAQELGLFAGAGLEVQITPQPSGAAGMTAVVAGAIDVAGSSVVQMASALTHGIELRYLAGAALWDIAIPNGALVVASDSPIQNARGFEGKAIGVAALKDLTHLSALAYLVKGGADPAKVSFIETPFPTMLAAVSAGRVAGAVSVVPWVPLPGDATRVLAPGFGSIADRYMLVGYFATQAWIQANRATARRFASVMQQAARWGNDKANYQRSAEIIEKYTKTLATAMQKLPRSLYAERLEPALIDPALEWEFREKFTDRRVRATELIAVL